MAVVWEELAVVVLEATVLGDLLGVVLWGVIVQGMVVIGRRWLWLGRDLTLNLT